MPINWQDGAAGGTPLSAANLNRLAVTADIGTPGTPTGDAVKAVVQVTDAKMAGAVGSATATAVAGRAELKRAYASTGPTDPGPSLPSGTEYVWMKTDGSGHLLDILAGVA